MERLKLILALVCMIVSTPLLAGERFVEAAGGFSYEIPNDWWTESFGNLKYKIVITHAANNFRPNMTLVDEKYAGTLKEYEQSSIPSMKREVPGFSVVSEGKGKTESGLTYRFMSYTHISPDIGKLIQTAYLLDLGNGQKLVMTCTPPSGLEDIYDPICLDIVRSLRLE